MVLGWASGWWMAVTGDGYEVGETTGHQRSPIVDKVEWAQTRKAEIRTA